MTANEILKLARDGKGRIVSSGDLCTEAISEARARGVFYVDGDGFGFAYLPWELTTSEDRKREHASVATASAPDLLEHLKHMIWLVETEHGIDGGHIVQGAKDAVSKAAP